MTRETSERESPPGHAPGDDSACANHADFCFVPTASLKRASDPFRDGGPWDGKYLFDRATVARMLAEDRLCAVPWDAGDTPAQSDDTAEIYDETYHARRVAYLVRHPSLEPILVDVGVPGLAFAPAYLVQDGCHRFAAAVFKGDAEIPLVYSGDEAVFRRRFRKRRRPTEAELQAAKATNFAYRVRKPVPDRKAEDPLANDERCSRIAHLDIQWER